MPPSLLPRRRFDPQYPIFIPSKGRAGHPYTIRALSAYKVPFTVIVEPPEVRPYEDALRYFGGYGSVLPLDPAFTRDYDACKTLAPGESAGSGPARNMAWAAALEQGAPWHWVVDDNIAGWWYYNRNRKMHAGDAAPIRLMEDFTDRYTNVAMAGPTYYMFVSRKQKYPPFTANTRIYSCNLIRSDLPFRWRGKYNEDTILSLDLLKAGYCTLLYNAWLVWKIRTGTVPGGNAEIYAQGTREKSEMLVREHPDVARASYRFSRDHHYVDYGRFRQSLIRKPDLAPFEYPRLDWTPRAKPVPLHPGVPAAEPDSALSDALMEDEVLAS